ALALGVIVARAVIAEAGGVDGVHRDGGAGRPGAQLAGPLVAVLVAFEDQVDPLVHQKVEQVGADLAALLPGRDAVAGHAHGDPADAGRPRAVDGVGHPLVVAGAGGVVVRGAVGHGDRRRDHDDPEQRRSGRVVEEVLLAVHAGGIHVVRHAGDVVVDDRAVLRRRPG